MIRRISRLSVVALGSILACVQVSRGNTISVSSLSQNTVTGVYTYSVILDSSTALSSGNGFAIFDILGLTSSSQASFTFTSHPVGIGSFTPRISLLGNYVLAGPGPRHASAPTGAPPNKLDLVQAINGGDDPLLENLSLVYSGRLFGAHAAGGPDLADGILTITGLQTGGTPAGIGVESTDAGNQFFSSTVLGPGAGNLLVPIPASFLGGGVLMLGLAATGVYKKMRSQLLL